MTETRDRHDTYIVGARGDAHYTMVEIDATTGWPLFLRVARMLGKPIGLLLESVLGAEGNEGLSLDNLSAADINIKGEPLGQAIEQLAGSLLEIGGVDFVKRLLADSMVFRDGKRFNPGKSTSTEDFDFGSTYRANYGELVKLLAWILRVNFGPLFGGLGGSTSGLSTKLKEALS